MTEPAQPETRHRPHAPPLASDFLEFELAAEVSRLHSESTWQNGQNARTLLKYDDLRVVLTALRAGQRIPEHKTDGRITVQVLSGHLRLRASARTFSLRAGSLLALDKLVPHDVEAVEDSAFLLTIAWPGRQAGEGSSG